MIESLGYNSWLVLLSFLVAAQASLTALDLAGRVRASRGLARHAWLTGGAVAMGAGIWSMHFIGMLALRMPRAMSYDLPITAVSLLVAILASALALRLVCVRRLRRGRLLVGGTVMGGGVCLMHYLGMEAMQVATPIRYSPGLLLLSIVIAWLAAGAALWLAFRLNPSDPGRRPKLRIRAAAALVMALGITGMHYTGMAAAHFTMPAPGAMEPALTPVQFAVTIAVIAVLVMTLALLIAVYDNYLASKSARLAASLQQANRELQSLVYLDPLTRLPNRLLLEQRLSDVLDEAKRLKTGFAVLFVDLDRFKSINDSLGHHIGDRLIQLVASRLRAEIREADVVARVGGDEFMVVTEAGTRRDDGEALAQRVVSSLGKAFQIDEQILRISCSVGVSYYPGHGDNPHELMIHADAAMYHAKDLGRNNYQFYETGMSSVAERRNVLERRLRLAIENDGLTLAYQPKVDVASGEITGVEALLRWHDEELGQVPPSEIIPIAEDTGLILPIGEWVLRTACRQVQAWHAGGLTMLPMAVNLSAIQLNNKHFVNLLARVLRETGLPARYLELELTESAIMQNPDNAQRILKQLRLLGVTLSIDDFGTGYSNLSQLKRFPIDRLKIDRSFTAGVVGDLQDAAIVKAVVMLAHSLNLEVVAEGVETDEQLAFIRGLKGQQYQGYLCSKALSADDLEQFLKAHEPQPA